jgi:hypothetical protein
MLPQGCQEQGAASSARKPEESNLATTPVDLATRDCGGAACVWNQPGKVVPKWNPAELPPCPGGERVEAERHEWIIHIHIQDITENSQDHAHFYAVHGIKERPSAEFKCDGWRRRNKVTAQMNAPRGPMPDIIDVTAVGPGQSITEYTDVSNVLQSQQVTPIYSTRAHLRWRLFHPSGISEGKMRVTRARMLDLVR